MPKSSRHEQGERVPLRQEGRMLHLTTEELQRMVEIASRNVILECERRTVTLAARESVKRRLLEEKERMIADDHRGRTSRTKQNVMLIPKISHTRETLDTTSSKIKMRREPVIESGGGNCGETNSKNEAADRIPKKARRVGYAE